MRLAFLSLALMACTVVNAAQLIVFGDSWGTEGAASLQAVLGDQHGITIDNVAVSGSTAAEWAQQPNFLRDTVAQNPDAKWVWITLGGNDAKNELPFGVTIPTVVEQCINNTQIILDPLFAAYPNIQVIQFGYDILTFSKGFLCPIFGEAIFPACQLNTTCINTQFTHLQTDYVEGMSKIYPNNHHSVDLRGTMQAAEGIPGASIGHPNLAYYSPDDLMQDNCIHPNDKGFVYIFNALWDLYFSKAIAAEKATAPAHHHHHKKH